MTFKLTSYVWCILSIKKGSAATYLLLDVSLMPVTLLSPASEPSPSSNSEVSLSDKLGLL